jgi:1-deoxy-D-xylulose-5-phosphate synthase
MAPHTTGNFDIAYFRCIPNMIVSAPMNEEELRNLMYTAQLPRLRPVQHPLPARRRRDDRVEDALQGDQDRQGRKGAFRQRHRRAQHRPHRQHRRQGHRPLQAEGYSVAHYDMRFAKPIDEMLLHEVFGKFKHVITIEDGCIQGGMGSAVLEFMADHGYQAAGEALRHPGPLDRARLPRRSSTRNAVSMTRRFIAAVKEMLPAKGARSVGVSA